VDLEAKEQLAGCLMVDVESIARAMEIAARWPGARHGDGGAGRDERRR
jgi:hypothetical protein